MTFQPTVPSGPMHSNLESRNASGGRRRWPLVLTTVVILLLAAASSALAWYNRQVRPPGPEGSEVSITIARGSTTETIARLLESNGVVSSARFFSYYLKANDANGIQAGEFKLHRGADLADIVDILTAAPKAQESLRLTVPEGLTLLQMAEVVGRLPGRSAARFLEAAASPTIRSRYQPPGTSSLEGLALPETYSIGPRETEADILRRMVAAFDDLANELDIGAASARLGVTPYQAMVVASLVEREARVAEDRGPIARVIYNRLGRKMPLQIDATVQFALGTTKPRLLYRDLEIDSPYNTYKIAGLPPGPIAAPGEASLRAALDPPVVPWIYYVLADADGRHAFAETGAQFERFRAEAERKGLL